MITQQEAIHSLLSLDIQNPNIWEFQFLPISNDYASAVQQEFDKFSGTSSSNLFSDEVFRVASISIPFHHFEAKTRQSGSKHYESWTPEGPFSITFWETTDFKVFNTFEKWKEQIYSTLNRTWGTGEVRRNAVLHFGNNQFVENKGIYFYRIMLLGHDDFDLDYSKTEGMQYKANFIADRVLPDHIATG